MPWIRNELQFTRFPLDPMGEAGARFAANRCERTTGRAAAYRLYRAGLRGNNTCAAPMIDSSTPRSCRGFTPHYRAGLVERSKRWTVKRYFDRSSTPRLIRPTILDPQILDDNPLIETNQAPPPRSLFPSVICRPSPVDSLPLHRSTIWYFYWIFPWPFEPYGRVYGRAQWPTLLGVGNETDVGKGCIPCFRSHVRR
jgi:hypothetical protein